MSSIILQKCDLEFFHFPAVKLLTG